MAAVRWVIRGAYSVSVQKIFGLLAGAKRIESGIKDVRTTMIYVHVMNKPGLAVKRPADSLG